MGASSATMQTSVPTNAPPRNAPKLSLRVPAGGASASSTMDQSAFYGYEDHSSNIKPEILPASGMGPPIQVGVCRLPETNGRMCATDCGRWSRPYRPCAWGSVGRAEEEPAVTADSRSVHRVGMRVPAPRAPRQSVRVSTLKHSWPRYRSSGVALSPSLYSQ